MQVKEERVYRVGEFELHEKGGFSHGNLAEVLSGMEALLISRDDGDGALNIMSKEVEFTARFMAVRFATDFEGDVLELYRALRKCPMNAEIFYAPEVEEAYRAIMKQWWEVEEEHRRREKERNSAGAAARQLWSMLFGEGAAAGRNAALIRSMLTQAMIEVRRDAKGEIQPRHPKVIDFSRFRAKKLQGDGAPEGDKDH